MTNTEITLALIAAVVLLLVALVGVVRMFGRRTTSSEQWRQKRTPSVVDLTLHRHRLRSSFGEIYERQKDNDDD